MSCSYKLFFISATCDCSLPRSIRRGCSFISIPLSSYTPPPSFSPNLFCYSRRPRLPPPLSRSFLFLFLPSCSSLPPPSSSVSHRALYSVFRIVISLSLRPPSSHIDTRDRNSMDRSAPEYSQTGLPSPYPSHSGDTRSEASSLDHASAAQYVTQQEVRPSNYSTAATPTSEYGVYPASARSASFPEHIQRPYHPSPNHSGSGPGMAQTPSSPSIPLPPQEQPLSPPPPPQQQQQQQNGDPGQTSYPPPYTFKSPLARSDDVPIDPSIAAPSPTYGAHQQYSPYGAPASQDMQHGYPHSGGNLYTQPRPDWAGYGGQPNPMATGHHVFQQAPNSAPPQARPTQVRGL